MWPRRKHEFLLTLAGIATGAGFVGTGLGHIAVGDAFSYYKQQALSGLPIERLQAPSLGETYSAGPVALLPLSAALQPYAAFDPSAEPPPLPEDEAYKDPYAYYDGGEASHHNAADADDTPPAIDRTSWQSEAQVIPRLPTMGGFHRDLPEGEEWESVVATTRLADPERPERTGFADLSDTPVTPEPRGTLMSSGFALRQ